VYQRLEVIGISILVLLGLALLQVLVLRSILMIKKKDYSILKFMGMRLRELKGIAYEEMGILCLAAVAVSLAVMVILWSFHLSLLRSIMPYYSLASLLLYVIYNLFLMAMTVFFFHRKVSRSLAEE
jgi:ABC-type antimicrobial peptide transport system permease subunit